MTLLTTESLYTNLSSAAVGDGAGRWCIQVILISGSVRCSASMEHPCELVGQPRVFPGEEQRPKLISTRLNK